MTQSTCVAVIGPGESAGPEVCTAARTVGRLLAERGITIICGGLGGVMQAASEGAAQAGGMVVGILPGHDRAAGNPFLTVALPTGLGELRNGLLLRSANGVIAIGGSWGTMSEVALARRIRLPLVSLYGWTVCDAAGETIPIERADTPETAVDRIVALLGEPGAA